MALDFIKKLFKSRNNSSNENVEEISNNMDTEETSIPDETPAKNGEIEGAKNIVSLGFEDLFFPDGASTDKDKASLEKLHKALTAFFDDQSREKDVDNCVTDIIEKQMLDSLYSHANANPLKYARIMGEKHAFCHYLMQLFDAFRFNTDLKVINDVFASMLDLSSLSFIDKMTLYFLLTRRFQELPLTLYNRCLNTLSLVAYGTESPFSKMIEKKYMELGLTPLSDSDLQQGAASYPRLEEIKRANIEKFLKERKNADMNK